MGRGISTPVGRTVARDGDTAARVPYETPALTDFGSIAEHTFQTPGMGTKAPQTCVKDMFGENSCPSG